MKPFDRGLLLIYSLFLTLFFIGTMPWLLNWNLPFYVWPFGMWLDPNYISMYWQAYIVVVIILIMIGIRLFWVSIWPSGNHQAVVHDGALGQVRIALGAIENLVEKVVAQNSGIKEVKARVMGVPQGIGIIVRATVTPDIKIPEVSDAIQQQVKERVLEVTGITVHNVRILVESISSQKPRVE